MAYSKPWITGPALFWLFMIVVVVGGYFTYSKAPKSSEAWLIAALKVSQEERMLRQMQDPLAMRLYVFSQMKISSGDSSSKIRDFQGKMIHIITDQWNQEVKQLGKDAYHMRSSTTWQANDLDPEAQALLKQVHQEAAASAKKGDQSW